MYCVKNVNTNTYTTYANAAIGELLKMTSFTNLYIFLFGILKGDIKKIVTKSYIL